ncbi:hypothetical protein EYF80_030222 [Liparis tanakae]|uniref:Uncharacterized protein n=1 Tax=Liparis tanakae TaxID=230148 RepID=A0A4Z2H3V8_9TELE|nr:hypothetical protein EYF80_030222 [Liparis tanakae]
MGKQRDAAASVFCLRDTGTLAAFGLPLHPISKEYARLSHTVQFSFDNNFHRKDMNYDAAPPRHVNSERPRPSFRCRLPRASAQKDMCDFVPQSLEEKMIQYAKEQHSHRSLKAGFVDSVDSRAGLIFQGCGHSTDTQK